MILCIMTRVQREKIVDTPQPLPNLCEIDSSIYQNRLLCSNLIVKFSLHSGLRCRRLPLIVSYLAVWINKAPALAATVQTYFFQTNIGCAFRSSQEFIIRLIGLFSGCGCLFSPARLSRDFCCFNVISNFFFFLYRFIGVNLKIS